MISRQPTLARNLPVLMISAGMLRPKKAGNAFASWHRYLNYGLLGLATTLKAAGHRPRVFHGHFEEPVSFVQRLAEQGWLETPAPIFLSIPSSYALEWASAACRAIKSRVASARIIVGGRWVVGSDGAWVRRQLPDADLVVYGLAERLVADLMDVASWPRQSNNDRAPLRTPEDQLPACLDYGLLDARDQFTPSFEVSRGCGRGCSFCAEGKVKLSAMKDAGLLADEIEAAYEAYGHRRSRAFFEASMFQPSTAWIEALNNTFAERAIDLRWRTETRVDNMSARQVHELARAGMRVLDLGLESASHEQLRRMNKTSNPEAYLRRASELLQACHEAGVWAKVNVLLYPGERPDTVAQTEEWLAEHKAYIKGVSAGPLILYRYGPETARYVEEIAAFEAQPTDPGQLEEKGFTDLHLSRSMPHDASVAACRRIAREMMTARDFYDLKVFSYFPPGTTYAAFMEHVQRQDGSAFAFSVPA